MEKKETRGRKRRDYPHRTVTFDLPLQTIAQLEQLAEAFGVTKTKMLVCTIDTYFNKTDFT